MSDPPAHGPSESLHVGDRKYRIYPPDRIPGVDAARLARRPITVRILLESLLRHGDGGASHLPLLRAVANGEPISGDTDLPFYPGRVLLQDFTGVPVVVDLTAFRSAAHAHGIPPERVNPAIPVDLVVDHSVQVDSFGSPRSRLINLDREYERNRERYRLLRWAQQAYRDFSVVPPGNGIVHQVNLEHIATVVASRSVGGETVAYPDTLLGTDSHTTMVNGLGVLGWGVGGIEAEAVLLGEPYFQKLPRVVGVELTNELPAGSTATDLVLTITHRLRQHGVVDSFVEFFGSGLSALSVADRATISNMCPEYGATAALFPVDRATLEYLRNTGRLPAQIALVEAYARRTGLWVEPGTPPATYDETLRIDLSSIEPTIAGPRNPEEAVLLSEAPKAFRAGLEAYRTDRPIASGQFQRQADDPLHPFPVERNHNAPASQGGIGAEVTDGSVVIAAITSCTNTSNPSVMIAAGLLARNARRRGLRVPPYVKTSLAPGSKVVTDYLEQAGLLAPLAELGFALVGYGCTTCIGNSGPLPPEVERSIIEGDAYVASVLSGNRNFEARIHNLVRANFLMSPPLVVAYALAGRMDLNLVTDPLGTGSDGQPVRLRDLWPSPGEISEIAKSAVRPEMYREEYAKISVGGANWDSLEVPSQPLYPWESSSTYLQEPPYLSDPSPAPPSGPSILSGARALLLLGDRVSTDHISPAGEIAPESPAGQYLSAHGVRPADFNTYGSRRGNHHVMMRGTFANVRLRNLLAAPREGGYTRHFPSGDVLTVFDAAERYRSERVPLLVVAGKSYGQGSSRDWAAKGPQLLGVRAILAEGYERIHRSNLIDMGVLPLQFRPGEGWKQLGLDGSERFDVRLPSAQTIAPGGEAEVVAAAEGREPRSFRVQIRIDSHAELGYFHAGGILPFVFQNWSKS